MKLRRVVPIGVAVLLPVLSVSWCTVHDDLLESHFQKISNGMSPAQVIEIMGTPTWNDRCGTKLPTGLPAECAREMGYAVALPMAPRHYLVWFGNDGRVVHTAPITSP